MYKLRRASCVDCAVVNVGTLVVARDIAHAKLKERLDNGEGLPDYIKNHPVYYAGPAKTPEVRRRFLRGCDNSGFTQISGFLAGNELIKQIIYFLPKNAPDCGNWLHYGQHFLGGNAPGPPYDWCCCAWQGFATTLCLISVFIIKGCQNLICWFRHF